VGPYYAETSPTDGILMYRDASESIAVLEAPDDAMPIGRALCIGWDAAGSAVWRLVVPDAEVDGPWVVVDREFIATAPGWRRLYRRDSEHARALPTDRPRGAKGAAPRRTTGRAIAAEAGVLADPL
jgi:hypothetical protein